jgi:phage anti-repressor protein
MYGKLHERRLNQQDYVMSCEVVRTEMADYVNEEARRVNEDSAKKRAVVQRNIPTTQT